MGPLRWLDWYGDGSLYVVDLALACCALEVEAAGWRRHFSAAPVYSGDQAVQPPAPADGVRVVVIVSGTVTDRLAPAVLGAIDGVARSVGQTPTVVSFGACASSGGPYWDSYAVTKGVDQVVPVDIYVPGCPPPPEALLSVLDELRGGVSA